MEMSFTVMNVTTHISCHAYLGNGQIRVEIKALRARGGLTVDIPCSEDKLTEARLLSSRHVKICYQIDRAYLPAGVLNDEI